MMTTATTSRTDRTTTSRLRVAERRGGLDWLVKRASRVAQILHRIGGGALGAAAPLLRRPREAAWRPSYRPVGPHC